MNYCNDLDEIDLYFTGRDKEFVSLFERWKLRLLEFDDCAALIAQLRRRLTDFALNCNAMPLRTPRQLMPTVRAIAESPLVFLEHVGNYDPEAVARVYGAFIGDSVERSKVLEDFEWGKGPPPDLEAIAEAVVKVVNELALEISDASHRGGQRLVLQNELILDLAGIFESFGGKIVRITRFDPQRQPSYVEDGPFHQFLKIVVPPARASARRAGFRMQSIRSLAGIPRKMR
ncbi:hypothetical protein [Aestuariivirga sp.]|uniref:hypothetical protein n=1 Tax=Aestuariivirga sp. TaxID=2650926 RepID=UPI003BAA3E30